MKKIIHLLAASLLTAPSFSTHAQEQTVESAQKFLSGVFENGASHLNIDSGLGWNRVRSKKVEKCEWREEFTGFFGGMKRTWWCGGSSTLDIGQSENWVDIGPLSIERASANGLCATEIAVSPASPRERWFKKRIDGEMTEFTLTSEARNDPFEIDWTKISGISKTEKTVSLNGVSPRMGFIIPSEEMAARVAYAMEFLRINCDKTAETGF